MQNYRVYICCGKTCGPKGSGQLVDFLEREVERLSLQDRVSVLPGGCQSHCESGPTMVVFPGPVFYQEVDRRRLQHIAVEHLTHDRPVEEYFWVDTTRLRPRDKRPQAGQPSQPSNYAFPKQDKPKKQAPKRSYEDVDDFKW